MPALDNAPVLPQAIVEYDSQTAFVLEPNGWCLMRRGAAEMSFASIEEATAYTLGRLFAVPGLADLVMTLYRRREAIHQQAHELERALAHVANRPINFCVEVAPPQREERAA